MLELIANVNSAVNGVVWGIPMLILATAPLIVAVFAAVIDAEHIFGIVCHHAEKGGEPHGLSEWDVLSFYAFHLQSESNDHLVKEEFLCLN